MDDVKIGIQIKKARLEAQLTQGELGQKIGVTWEMISRYENGKSSPRKNLEKISEVLGKPIQYFFGVEEAPISEEIKRLTKLLIKKGEDLQRGGEVPYLETLNGFPLKKAISLTNQSYSCPSWIYSRYSNVYALRLDDIGSDILSIGKGDIGYFTNALDHKIGDYILFKEKSKYRIDKYRKGFRKKVIAILLAVEKRYHNQ